MTLLPSPITALDSLKEKFWESTLERCWLAILSFVRFIQVIGTTSRKTCEYGSKNRNDTVDAKGHKRELQRTVVGENVDHIRDILTNLHIELTLFDFQSQGR